jgi:hypothetical protein
MVEEGNIIERDRKLDVAGMTGARPRVLTTCSTPRKISQIVLVSKLRGSLKVQIKTYT